MLHCQPRIDTRSGRSGRIIGAESLVRWQHPTDELIAPGPFIFLAEESGLLVEIGAWITCQAGQQHLRWRKASLSLMLILINLSTLQLKDDDLISVLKKAIATFNVPAAQIELKLTESLLVDNVAATILILNRIKALGFLQSIDDFGTGYSNFNYLSRGPIDKLKMATR